MKTEKEKMVAGEMYRSDDPELVRARIQARKLVKMFNETAEEEIEKREKILSELFGVTGEKFTWNRISVLNMDLIHV